MVMETNSKPRSFVKLLANALVLEWLLIEARKSLDLKDPLSIYVISQEMLVRHDQILIKYSVQLFPSSGTGDAKTPSWFYDVKKATCTAFLYSGSGGNANR